MFKDPRHPHAVDDLKRAGHSPLARLVGEGSAGAIGCFHVHGSGVVGGVAGLVAADAFGGAGLPVCADGEGVAVGGQGDGLVGAEVEGVEVQAYAVWTR